MQHSLGFVFSLDIYKMMEEKGIWVGVVVEVDGEVGAYCSLTFSPHLHNTSRLLARVDFIGTNKEYRGMGLGKIILREVEEMSKKKKAAILSFGLKDHKSGVLKNMLLSNEYSYTETTYSKEI